MLRELIEEGKSYTIAPQINVLRQPYLVDAKKCEDFLKWEMKALLYLQQEYGKNALVSDFKKSIDEDKKTCYIRTLYFQLGILEAFEQIQPKVVNIDYDLITTTSGRSWKSFSIRSGFTLMSCSRLLCSSKLTYVLS